MPTIMTHAIVPLAMAAGMGRHRINPRIALAAAALAILPDADVAGFALGVDYGDPWGHRGATHSLVFAGCITAVLALIWPLARRPIATLFLFMSAASHGILDMFTSGGLGAALYWPFDYARHFAPWTPIRVSPIGADFFSARGPVTLRSEAFWVWLPCIAAASAMLLWRRSRTAG